MYPILGTFATSRLLGYASLKIFSGLPSQGTRRRVINPLAINGSLRVNAPNLLPEKVSSSPSVVATRRVVFAPVRASPDALSKRREGVE
jgi:hypothetical protein